MHCVAQEGKGAKVKKKTAPFSLFASFVCEKLFMKF